VTMLKTVGRFSAPALAYVLLLVAFVSLGVFVAALATESGLTALLGVLLIACLTGSVAGFRAAARKLAKSGAGAEPSSAVSIFSTPLQRHHIDRYLKYYRGEGGIVPQAERTMTVIVGGESTERRASRESERHRTNPKSTAPRRLSA
jgi:hypothetical protein